MIKIKPFSKRVLPLVGAAAFLSILSLTPSAANPVAAQSSTPPAVGGRTNEGTLPWWRVAQLKRTIDDDDAILNVSNRLFVQDVKVDESSGKINVLGVVDWEDILINAQDPRIGQRTGRHLEGLSVKMELFYKHARLGDVADVRHYTRIAEVSATSVANLLSVSAMQDVTPTMGALSFTVDLVNQSVDESGKVISTPRPFMPGEYQVKLTIHVNSQLSDLQKKMLHPSAMVREDAIMRRKTRFMNSQYTLAELKREGAFDEEGAPSWTDNMVLEWRNIVDKDGNKSREPLRCVEPIKVGGVGRADVQAWCEGKAEVQGNRDRNLALRDLEKGNIKLSPAFAKFYYRPAGYQPKEGEPLFARDRIFLDNGTLEASVSLAQETAARDRIAQDLECWTRRRDIWSAKAQGESWVAPAPDSDEARELSTREFFSLPSAKARAARCKDMIDGLALANTQLNEQLAFRKAPLREVNGVNEIASVENADLDRLSTLRDIYERFDDPIIYGMSEIIHGDFVYWRWRMSNIYSEVSRTIFYNRLPWERPEPDAIVFGEDKKNPRVPTTSLQWLQYLYAKAYVLTYGNTDAKGVLIPGETKPHSGGVYSEEILSLIHFDLFGADGKQGTKDDLDLERWLTKDQDRRMMVIWVTDQKADGTAREYPRSPRDNEKTKTAPDNTTYMPGKGYMLNERNWMDEERRVRQEVGFAIENQTKPLNFFPFAKTYSVTNKDFSVDAKPNSTLGRIQALNVKGKYFPDIGRYEEQIKELETAAKWIAEVPAGVRYSVLTKYNVVDTAFAAPREFVQWNAEGQSITLRKERKVEFKDGKPSVVDADVQVHPFMPLDSRFDASIHQDKSRSAINKVISYMRLDDNRIGIYAPERANTPVFANWFFQVGPGRGLAKGEIILRTPQAIVNMAEIDKRHAADRKKAEEAARKKGPEELAAWRAKEKARVEREKLLEGDPEMCPHKLMQKAQAEAQAKAAELAKLPTKTTREETARMGLQERFPATPNLTKAETDGYLPSHSGGVGQKNDG